MPNNATTNNVNFCNTIVIYACEKINSHNFMKNFVAIDMARGRWLVRRGSMSRGSRSCGRCSVDVPIALPPNEHAPTLPLGDAVDDPCANATNKASSSW